MLIPLDGRDIERLFPRTPLVFHFLDPGPGDPAAPADPLLGIEAFLPKLIAAVPVGPVGPHFSSRRIEPDAALVKGRVFVFFIVDPFRPSSRHPSPPFLLLYLA